MFFNAVSWRMSLCSLICALTLLGPQNAAIAQTDQTAIGQGDASPVLAFNLSAPADWAPVQPYIDLIHVMRPWIAGSADKWQVLSHQDLRDANSFDADGWPIRIPDGLHIKTIFAWTASSRADPVLAAQRAGTYVLDYQGQGDLTLSGDVQITQNSPGRITFENRNGGNIILQITRTDANNHLRDIRLFRADQEPLLQAGALFHPDWLALIDEAREIRFMNWMGTNNATIQHWRDWPTPDQRGQSQIVPVEHMVRLANEIGADPWFTMPHRANDRFMRQFARYVRDNLDPALKAHVEYSNEVWNGAFAQARWVRAQSERDWGTPAPHSYYTMKATQMAQIWRDEFGPAADDRLVLILGGQTVNTWATNQILTAPAWRTNAPRQWRDPATVFDEFAITTYFGSALVRQADLRAQVLDITQVPAPAAYDWLERTLRNPATPSSLPAIIQNWSAQADLAHAHGLRLTAYEGGQHVHHSFAVRDLTRDQTDAMQSLMTGFVRSAEMGDLYQTLWQDWQAQSDGPFMQFTEGSGTSRSGTWGLYQSHADSTPRSQVVKQNAAQNDPWWNEPGGPQYLHGVVRYAPPEGATLQGTAQEDYLIGADGDDTFIESGGRDGINGGSGLDNLILSAPRDSYQFDQKEAGVTVTSPTGVIWLYDVETVQFPDGQVMQIHELAR
ncbi:calcium-binding protein [Aestuariibius sp. HNIBRBA575]|uniref:calcium-binding protein n=1 Tax=Aestuariibius sp. HNIBRBA575 TaxID=3233343 RepID=UPI0034A25A88